MKSVVSNGEYGHSVEERGDARDAVSHIGVPELEMPLPTFASV